MDRTVRTSCNRFGPRSSIFPCLRFWSGMVQNRMNRLPNNMTSYIFSYFKYHYFVYFFWCNLLSQIYVQYSQLFQVIMHFKICENKKMQLNSWKIFKKINSGLGPKPYRSSPRSTYLWDFDLQYGPILDLCATLSRCDF